MTTKKLGGWKSGPETNLTEIRDLSEDEVIQYGKSMAVYAAARNRFRLFRIFHLNYKAWEGFVKATRKPGGALGDEMLELDRLMLNFLTAAKALIDHFTQFYIQSHRKTPEENHFSELLDLLSGRSWAFAFFQDFRNFVQHCGLPTGSCEMSVKEGLITMEVGADAEWLLANHTGWKLSKLAKTHGKLNLLTLAHEYYQCVMSELGMFLAKAFFPKVVEAHNFFAVLANEVAQVVPTHTMILITQAEGNGNEVTLSFELIPNDVFGELGFQVKATV
jgi:hypothetical protein